MLWKWRFDGTCGLYPQRFYLCFLCLIGLTLNYIMRFTIAIVITEMVKPTKAKIDPDACPVDKSAEANKKKEPSGNLVEWTEMQQGIVLSSFFWGYVLTQVPAGMIADRFGPRRVMLISAFLTTFLTAISPVSAIYGGMWGFTVVRILLGLVQGCFYASLHTVVAQWVPTEERGLWGTIVFSGAHTGNFLQNMFNGVMLDTLHPNWEWIFYIWSTLAFIWTILFFFSTWDNYKEVPTIKEKEVAVLDAYYEKASKKKAVKFTPWKEILKSLPVWATILAAIGHDWGLFALVVDLPKYMKSVLQLDVLKNGMYLGLGYLALCIVAYSSGWLVDFIEKKKLISITWNRIIFTSIASVGPSVGLVASSWVACNQTAALVILLFGMCTMGCYYPSLKVNPIDLSPNHAGAVGAIGNSCGAFAGLCVTFLIGAITPESTRAQWSLVWWITFAVMSVTNLFYFFFASGEIQPFNKIGIEES